MTLVDEHRAQRRFGTHAILAFVAVFVVAVPFGVLVLMVTTRAAPVIHVDQNTSNALHAFALHHHRFTAWMLWISRIGSPLGWWVVLTPVTCWLVYRRLHRLAAFLVVTALGSSLLNDLTKSAVDRARPTLIDPVARAHGTSFPSGHAQAATVGCGILVLIFLPVIGREHRRWLWLAAALVVATIGFSRIALGVHYLSDVLGGLLIGAAWLIAMTTAFSAWQRERRRAPSGATEGLDPDARNQLLSETQAGQVVDT